MEFFPGFDLTALIKTVGLFGLFFIVFAESGLLLGFFLPGDSLLFTAGFLASQGFANIWALIAGCFVAAVLGDNFGYAFGRRIGPAIFKRERSMLFNPQNLERAHRFYERYGGKAIVLSRFLPAIRTFAPILAGVGVMRYSSFVFYNIIGAGLWAIGMPLAGYFLGRLIPGVDRYLLPIVLVIIILSVLPSVISLFGRADNRRMLLSHLKKDVSRHPILRKLIGVFLILFGLVALAVPFFPFGWVAFFGFQLLGWRLVLFKHVKQWWQNNPSDKI